jgi:peptidoglycan/LPS O-acetylase OafA/YrhL
MEGKPLPRFPPSARFVLDSTQLIATAPTSSAQSPRSHGLDTMRALAILSVVVFHILDFHGRDSLPGWLVPAASEGWMGVDLFFVLSGYLISAQFLRTYRTGLRPRLGSFYRNRLYRVIPAYAVVLALYYAWPNWRESDNLPAFWTLITFTQNLFANIPHDHAFSHVWSLCVEEHFYLLFPLIVLVMMRKRSETTVARTVALLAALVLAGIAIRTFVLFHTLRPMAEAGEYAGRVYMNRIYYPTYSRLDGLLAGVALGLVKTFRPVWWRAFLRRGHSLLVIGLCLTGIAGYLFWDRWDAVTGAAAVGTVIGPPLLSAGLACLVASALSSNGWLRYRIPGAQLLATLAYSMYLTHKELIHLIDQWFPSIAEGAMVRWLCVYAVACMLAAAILYLCVERPFLVLRDRRAGKL